MEALYTFREGDNVRRRWVRVVYQDTRQFTVTAQAATVEEFEQWRPIFQSAMNNFRIYAKPQYKDPRPAPAPETRTAQSAPAADGLESTGS